MDDVVEKVVVVLDIVEAAEVISDVVGSENNDDLPEVNAADACGRLVEVVSPQIPQYFAQYLDDARLLAQIFT